MEQAAILKSGTCVKITDLTSPAYTIYGFLNNFLKSDGKKYRETLIEQFREEDQWDVDAIGGFYQEEAFLKYLNKDKEMPLYKLKEYYYKFNLADEDDEINVKKLKLVAPYNEFCVLETYKWPHKKNIDLLDKTTELIIIPATVQPDPLNGENVQLFGTSPNLFFSSNINQFVTPLPNLIEQQARAFVFAKIALRIHQIKKDIFQLFNATIFTDFGVYMTNQDNQWSTGTTFVNPTFNDIEDYYRNLTAFYKSAYANQIAIQQAPKEEKFYWLARCLTAEGLAIVPVQDKIELLKSISVLKNMTEANGAEALAIKIVESLTFDSVLPADRNLFLDELMKNQVYNAADMYNATSDFDSHKTLFEILFSNIDDNRSSRYTFGLINTDDNRKKFILMLYKVWKSSKYYPQYGDPSYTLPANAFGVYPESYYMELMADGGSSIEKAKYYDSDTSPAFIYYDSSLNTSSLTEHSLSTTNVEFFLDEIQGKKIDIRKKTTTTTTDLTSTRENNQHVSTFSSLYGTYDLYQPIGIIGFKPDLDFIETFKDPVTGINLSNSTPSIPVFLLYYLQDYSSLKKIDFGIMMATEIALNLTGVGAISDLKYIGYLSKMRFLWTGEAVASTEVVLGWSAVSSTLNAFEFTAINAISINQYVANTTNDMETKVLAEKANKWLMWATIGSVLLKPRVQANMFDAAAELDSEITSLMNNSISIYRPGMTAAQIAELDDAFNVVRSLTGNILVAIDGFVLKIGALDLQETNLIATRYAAYTDSERLAFYRDFGQVKETETEFWNLLNKTSSLDNYDELRNLGVIERNEAAVFSNVELKNAYIRYYDESVLREALEKIGFSNRVKFLEDFKDQPSEWFDFLIGNPSAIERWNKLDSSAKFFAKTKPDVWLYRFDRLYQNFSKWNRLSDSEILARFGPEGLNLVNQVEAAALTHISTAGANQLKLRDILISGMKDKNANLTSGFYVNFTEKEILRGDYNIYLDGMFPNLKARIDDIAAFNRKNYNMSDFEYSRNAGDFPGAHAEVRALNDLAKQRFPDYHVNPPSDIIFNDWLKNDVLGYNRNIQKGIGQQNVIMHTCCDCFHILDLVTFIRPL